MTDGGDTVEFDSVMSASPIARVEKTVNIHDVLLRVPVYVAVPCRKTRQKALDPNPPQNAISDQCYVLLFSSVIVS